MSAMTVRARYRLGNETTRNSFAIRISPDGERVLTTWNDGRSLVGFVNDVPLEPADWHRGKAPSVRWSTDLRSSVHVHTDSRVSWVTVDSHRVGPFAEVSVPFEPFANNELVFAAKTEAGWWAFVGPAKYGPYSEVSLSNSSPFAVREGRSWFVVAHDHQIGPYTKIRQLRGLPSGDPVFAAERRGESVLVCGDDEFGPYEGVIRSFDARPGRWVAAQSFGAKPHGAALQQVFDGDTLLMQEVQVRSLEGSLSPNGQRLAFAYDRQDSAGYYSGFYVDGERTENLGYSDGPWWSPEGRLAWGRSTSTIDELVFDDRVVGLSHQIDWEYSDEFRFMPDGRFVIVLRDRRQDGNYVKIGDEIHGPLLLQRSGSTRRAIVAGTARYAFICRPVERPSGSFVQWNGQTLGPFVHVAATVLSNDRLVLAHVDEGGTLTVQEHA